MCYFLFINFVNTYVCRGGGGGGDGDAVPKQTLQCLYTSTFWPGSTLE